LYSTDATNTFLTTKGHRISINVTENLPTSRPFIYIN